jgi:glycosyltransferase involved in cell wall biosynthesis
LLRGAGVAVHHAPHYTMPEHAAVPRVVTIHDLTFFDHPEWHEHTKVAVFRRAIRVATRHAEVLICVSDRTAARLEELFAPVGRVMVVPHGVDAQRFCPTDDSEADETVLRALGVRRPYVVFVGTIEPRKAVPDLVAAFDRLAGRDPDLSLVLAGSPGWGTAAVERALASARAGDRVVRTGYVADDAVPTLLRRASAVAYPARAEGFGLPALEALACGAPLVTTVGTAMAELAGDAAFLVPPGSVPDLADALAEAVADGPPVRSRRRLGLQVAAAHTWSAAAAGHVAAYGWAAGVRTPPRSRHQ